MINILRNTCLVMFLFGCSLASNSVTENEVTKSFMVLANINPEPKVYDVVKRSNEIIELYLEGQSYKGKSTRIFALYSLPKDSLPTTNGKIPAVVLVHGGGGSAFEKWVTKWNDAGFAAISIAVEGQTDQRNSDKSWKKHIYAGPARSEIYGDSDNLITDQWMYHAVAAAITARKFLASQTVISKEDIGISGISWGGVITSTVIGFDPSFKFAIPIYGNGFLDSMANQYGSSLVNNDTYKDVWEPGLRIDKFKNPSLWLTWRDDVHFSLDAQAKTYGLLNFNVTNAIKPNIKHGHIAGWKQPESYFFAQQVIKNKESWIENIELTINKNNTASAIFKIKLAAEEFKVKNVSVNFTTDKGHTGDAIWLEIPAIIDTNTNGNITTIFRNMPEDVTHWFFNIEFEVYSDTFETNELITVSSGVFSSYL